MAGALRSGSAPGVGKDYGGNVKRDDTNVERDDTVAEETIRLLLRRLGRRHASGGTVVERAAILAEGGDFDTIVAWIAARGGAPEASVSSAAVRRGLHGTRLHDSGGAQASVPARFVLPAGALD
ncbi:MAG: hypothetical protein QOH46_1440 [Solirubrobacteraceae bacterium]|nr:hypothetical protein [Solirubrobacteraceae bacterium]